MARNKRYKKRVSDRSGFDYLERELIKQGGLLVGPDEYDTPPPSNISLGGEGDSTIPTDARTDYTSWATDSSQLTVVQYVTTASSISTYKRYDKSGQRNFNQEIVYIAGSNSTMTLASNPQVAASMEGDRCTIESVGSAVTLVDGNGLSLRKEFRMDSGALINLYYTTGGSVWNEVSRSHKTKSLGEL